MMGTSGNAENERELGGARLPDNERAFAKGVDVSKLQVRNADALPSRDLWCDRGGERLQYQGSGSARFVRPNIAGHMKSRLALVALSVLQEPRPTKVLRSFSAFWQSQRSKKLGWSSGIEMWQDRCPTPRT
jgi:hypothetical protein